MARRFDVNEFDAHADARLDDSNYGEALCDLALARERDARARFQRQGLAGANETAA
jgi:hypothetical protein